MAEVDSSPMFLGKRTTDRPDPAEVDMFSSIMKRRRPVDSSEEPIEGVYDSIEDSWEVGQSRRMPQTSLFEKRHRQITEQDNDIDAPMYSQRHFEFLQHQHEHAFNKLREEFERALSEEQAGMQNLTNDQHQLVATLQQMQVDMERMNEENKILKRGIHIQYNKTEELKQENANLRETLSNAAEYIARTERTNEALRVQLAMMNHPSSMMNFQPPPDVF